MAEKSEIATFGAGCFWGVEASFQNVIGVVGTSVGYMGGALENPTYEQVCTDRTGHAEVVHVTFDPNKVSYKDLLEVFWQSHDPTQKDRQGPDVGHQYRSVVFTHSNDQAEAVRESITLLQGSGAFAQPIATVVEPAQTFFPAEDYHQRYLEKRGQVTCRI